MTQSIILLTYKGKVLLVQADSVFAIREENPWHFIAGERKTGESCERTIQREVEKETSILLKSIEFLGSLAQEDEEKYFYHTRLTDDNVNNIVRQEGKVLGFFSPKELDTLFLSFSTKLLITRHKDVLGKVDTVQQVV